MRKREDSKVTRRKRERELFEFVSLSRFKSKDIKEEEERVKLLGIWTFTCSMKFLSFWNRFKTSSLMLKRNPPVFAVPLDMLNLSARLSIILVDNSLVNKRRNWD